MSEIEVRDWIGRYPVFNPEIRALPTYYRAHQLDTISFLVVPLPEHLRLATSLSRLLRKRYLAQNPFSPGFQSGIGRPLVTFADGTPAPLPPAAQKGVTGMGIIGLSGLGKTTAVELILAMYPQVIVHSMFAGRPFTWTQLVWIKLECPHDGSVKGLCQAFFKDVDFLLNTNFVKQYAHSRATVDTMIQGMASVASIHGLGMLVIDEIQHLNQAKSGGADIMLNFFVQLVNQVGVPVVPVGTPGALDLLARRFRQARRMSGVGDFRWEPMKQDLMWHTLCEILWRYQYVREETVLTNEIVETLYDESQGIVDIVIKLFILAQLRAMETGAERLSPSLIRSVAKDQLGLLRPLLRAIKMRDEVALRRVQDVSVDLQETIERATGTTLRSNPDVVLPPESKVTVAIP
jgi:hypothetical protein